MARRKSVLQAASDAFGAYLQTALGSDVRVYSSWPEPDQKLRKAVTLTSVGPRQVDYNAGEIAPVVKVAELVPPDPVLKNYTFAVAVFRQSVQLDVWATSFVECDDILARLDDILTDGLGASLGQANADPNRDGSVVALNPADGHEGFAEFLFDGQDDDQTSAQSGRDEWRATIHGECSVNYQKTKTLPTLKSLKLAVKFIVDQDPGDTELFTVNADGTRTHTTITP